MRRAYQQVSSPLRLARGLVLGLAMLLLTAAAHSAAHGQLPDVTSLAVLLPVSAGLSIIAMERPHGVTWFLLFAVGMQSLLHVLLVTASGHAGHHASLLPDTTMLIAHLCAAVLLAIVLSHLDSALLRWLAYMRTILLNWPAETIPIPGQALPQIPPLQTSGASFDLTHDISRRGPPASRR